MDWKRLKKRLADYHPRYLFGDWRGAHEVYREEARLELPEASYPVLVRVWMDDSSWPRSWSTSVEVQGERGIPMNSPNGWEERSGNWDTDDPAVALHKMREYILRKRGEREQWRWLGKR